MTPQMHPHNWSPQRLLLRAPLPCFTRIQPDPGRIPGHPSRTINARGQPLHSYSRVLGLLPRHRQQVPAATPTRTAGLAPARRGAARSPSRPLSPFRQGPLGVPRGTSSAWDQQAPSITLLLWGGLSLPLLSNGLLPPPLLAWVALLLLSSTSTRTPCYSPSTDEPSEAETSCSGLDSRQLHLEPRPRQAAPKALPT